MTRGLVPREVVFVGHDAEELAGAAAAGMMTAAFNFDRHAQADVYLDRFDQLNSLLQPSAVRAAA